MYLTDLPYELVERILGFLVGEVRPLHASHYRLVSKLFAHGIQEQILKRQPLRAFSGQSRPTLSEFDIHSHQSEAARDAEHLNTVRFGNLFAKHGGTILANKLLSQKGKHKIPIMREIQAVVDAILALEEEPVTDDLRKRYTLQICTAVSSERARHLRSLFMRKDPHYREIPRPAPANDTASALAATNQISRLILRIEGDPTILLKSSKVLPDPLQAASACGHIEVAREIVQRMSMDEALNRYQINHERKAFITAMTMGQKDMGHFWLDRFLGRGDGNLAYRGALRLYESAFVYPDNGFVGKILEARSKKKKTKRLNEADARLPLQTSTCSVLRFLLENDYLDANVLGDTTPLTLAVQNRRYDLARTLLRYGAQIDGVPLIGPPVTALYSTALKVYQQDSVRLLSGVRFLLENGADPNLVGNLGPVKDGSEVWHQLDFLLSQAREHGNEVALRPETWEQYEKARAGRKRDL